MDWLSRCCGILAWICIPASGAAQTRVVSQEVYPLGQWIGPFIERVPYEEQVQPTIWMNQLGLNGAMVLKCEYGITFRGQQSTAMVNFWYRKVGARPSDVVAVHPAHPMALLGEEAFAECPPHEEGAQYAQQALQEFRRLAAARVANDQTGTLVRPIDPSEPVTCAALDTQSGNFEFFNGCDFDVNYQYCRSLLKTPRSPCQSSGQVHAIRSKARHSLAIPYTGKAVAFACRAPYVPVTRVVDDHGFKKARQFCEQSRRRR
ncbi:hypothetical protein [Gemmatimonas sp.]